MVHTVPAVIPATVYRYKVINIGGGLVGILAAYRIIGHLSAYFTGIAQGSLWHINRNRNVGALVDFIGSAARRCVIVNAQRLFTARFFNNLHRAVIAALNLNALGCIPARLAVIKVNKGYVSQQSVILYYVFKAVKRNAGVGF